MTEIDKFSTKLVLVTGAAGGIGKAVISRCLRMGARVCATDKSARSLKDVEIEMLALYPGQFFALPMDVENMDSIIKAEKEINSRCGGVDVLINNAGVFVKSDALKISEELFKKTLDVNLMGPLRTTQVFVPQMIERGGGKIINISSVAAVKGAPGAAHYAASKAGLVALSLSLACEFASKNIQVNVVLPGYIESPMTAPDQDALKVISAWRIPARRMGLPWEVAEAVCFLASSEASYLTGSQIVVDGGFTIA